MLTVEQIMAAQQAQVATLFGLSSKAFESLEKLAALNLQASKSALSETAAHSLALLGAKDPQAFVALQTEFVQPLAEKSVAYGRHVYEITSGASEEFTKNVEAQAADAQKQFASLVDGATKNAPQGSEQAIAAIKAAMSNATSAYEAMQKSVKQATEIAQSNLAAVTTQATKAAKSTAKAR